MTKNISYFLTGYFPLVFSLSVCSGFGTMAALILSCLSILLMPELQPKKLMPFIVSFLIIGIIPVNKILTALISGTLLIVYSLIYDKIKYIFSEVFTPGIMLAGALTSTVLFTTYYFGIGATGESVAEMIKSYISLGFHPNWRGVLYGTIVLVLMITFPRKFKTFSRYVSAPFIALLFTLILNLFLNPSDMVSAISEIPGLDRIYFKDFILSDSNSEFNISSVINGIALFLLCACSFSQNDENSKKDCLIYSGANLFSCGIFSLPLPYGVNKNKSSIMPRIIAVLFLCASFFIFKDVIERIPLHSCAVVIIVTAWESVKWSELKNSFSGLKKIILFIIPLAVSLLANISIAIIVSFIILILLSIINIKKAKPAD